MNLVVFEDFNADRFYPLSVSHPVYDLIYGCFNVIERFKHYFKPDNIFLWCRDYLADISRQRYDCQVNNPNSIKGTCIFINAALKPDYKMLNDISRAKENTVFFNQSEFIAAKLTDEVVKEMPLGYLPKQPITFPTDIKRVKVKAELFEYPWDIVSFNGEAINLDVLEFWSCENPEELYQRFNSDKPGIYIHPSAKVSANAFFDVSEGPVVIDEAAVVEPRSLIQGPVYIGKNSRVMGGIIREGCSIGPVCKIGGELEQSIVLGYSNKCHEGFIGHSYIGEWVNLGALTANSDLKNNYSEVTVRVKGKDIPTGLIKVGSFIGDHTKTGIGTLLNTGIVIGFCCNMYGGMLFPQKEIGSFRWGTPEDMMEFKLDKAVQIAKISMKRRGMEFSVVDEKLFNIINERTP